MQLDAVLGACAGLMLSALLVVSREDCAQWVLARLDGAERFGPPVSGAVTGTGIFFAIASVWLLVGCLR
jgi:predicted CDP-diglyceride synthetase/phosphatidate cytidylyltransferase